VETPDLPIIAAAEQLLPNVTGIGIDLVDIQLMEALVIDGGSFFVDAFWSPAEQVAADNRIECVAGQWAAKEAVMKSLGHGIGDLDPIDIEIVSHSSGAPYVVLHRSAAQLAKELKVNTCHVSITHEASWAAAIALAVKE
jgi:holo-[acyl-carrier protein] synthase